MSPGSSYSVIFILLFVSFFFFFLLFVSVVAVVLRGYFSLLSLPVWALFLCII